MQTIVMLFKKSVDENSERIAVIADGIEYTYKQLDEYSNYIAEKLNEVANIGARIGVCIERSIGLIASVIGILKAGMSYVPLDDNYPQARLKYMCDEANIKHIICRDSGKWGFIENRIILEKTIMYKSAFIHNCKEEEEAYVIFTSGSTGQPKGVSVSHISILNTLLWRIRYFSLNVHDKVLQIPSISYSSSVEDIFSTLFSGGTLVMIHQKDLINVKKIALMINQYEITHLLLIPSLYNELVPHLKNNKLRFVVVAGEAILPQIIEKHYMYMENVLLYNEYGMTETSVAFSAGILSMSERRCNIGKPIDNMSYKLNNLEDGVGELVVVGPGVASGYVNDNENLRFLIKNGEREFYTGDLVKVEEDGNLIYYGRKDSQIKKNGKRFDLTEIRQIIKAELNIDAVAVVDKKDKIVCYISSDKDLEIEKVSNILKEKIPMLFLPKRFKKIKHIYKLPNGKIDYGKLKQFGEDEIEDV